MKAHAWAIFFKINEIHEVISSAAKDIARAVEIANAKKMDLWQILQFSPHDPRELYWETPELVLLIDHKQFDVMIRYQEATIWLTNFIQSAKLYREMRLKFLINNPSSVDGDSGTMTVTDEQLKVIMPTIAHLNTLANSLAKVISDQQPDIRKLLRDYARTMKVMIGTAPQLEFLDEKKAGPTPDEAEPSGS